MTNNTSDLLNSELDQFLQHKEYFSLNNLGYFELDEYGFALNCNASKKIDICLFGLTHGDEVIGLQIINLILNKFKMTPALNLNFAFVLNNIEAFKANKRYLDYDLNRSFLIASDDGLERKRAVEIEEIILKCTPKLIIDLHQTIERCTKPFCIIPEIPEIILLAHQISSEIPVICFSDQNGFSELGKTLIEFANTNNIPALVYEIGQKGFNIQNANKFVELLLNLNINQLPLFDHSKAKQVIQKIEYYLIMYTIPNVRNYRLKPNLESLNYIKKDETLANNINGEEFKSPENSLIIFPRYQNILEHEKELGYLAVLKET